MKYVNHYLLIIDKYLLRIMLTRGKKLLALVVSSQDIEKLNFLNIPNYESTKGSTHEHKKIAINLQNGKLQLIYQLLFNFLNIHQKVV